MKKPLTEEKVWGAIQELYKDKDCRLVKARAVATGYCSTHLHRHMDNAFILLSGRLRVVSFSLDGKIESSVLLDKNRQSVTIKAGVKHRFECVSDCVFYELYLGQHDIVPDENDIVRDDVGGLRATA